MQPAQPQFESDRPRPPVAEMPPPPVEQPYQPQPAAAPLVEPVEYQQDPAPQAPPASDDAERARAEVQAEQDWPKGTIGLTLYTDRGNALIHVPPRNKWRASAVNALNNDDSLGWAMSALDQDEALTWRELDPTVDETERFFRAWGRIVGQTMGESRASKRS